MSEVMVQVDDAMTLPTDEEDDLRIAMMGRPKEISGMPHSTQNVLITASALDDYSSSEEDSNEGLNAYASKPETAKNPEALPPSTSTHHTGKFNIDELLLPLSEQEQVTIATSRNQKKRLNKTRKRLVRTSAKRKYKPLEIKSDNPNLITTTSSSNDKHICKLCNKSFSNPSNARYHFKYHCSKRREPKTNPNLIPLTSSKLGKHICKLCNYSFANIYSAQRHLLGNSCKGEMKSDPNIIPVRSCRKVKYICKLCNKSFPKLYSVKRHLNHFCSKNAERTRPEADMSMSLTCAYCSYQCGYQHNLMERHLVCNHPETFFPSERNSSNLSSWKEEHFQDIVTEIVFSEFMLTDDEMSSNSSSCSCSICGMTYFRDEKASKNRCYLKIHLVNNHIQQLRDYLKMIIEHSDDDSLKEELDNLYKQPGRRFRRAGRKHEKEERRLLSCAYCNYQSVNREHRMKAHLIHHHPEMFFQSERDIASLSPWKTKNFERILKEIVIPKFILRNGVSASCSLCGKKYECRRWFNMNRSDLIVHLINNHIQDVKEYLKDILKESATALVRKLRDVDARFAGNQQSQS